MQTLYPLKFREKHKKKALKPTVNTRKKSISKRSRKGGKTNKKKTNKKRHKLL